MKKRRSTVYVRPGKDVTLYVPVETPPEVVDYMNELKQEGMFSQGIIDILSDYVQRQGRSRRLDSEGLDSEVLDSRVLDPGVMDPRVSDRGASRHAASQEVTLEQTAATFETASGVRTENHVSASSNTPSSDSGADSSRLSQEQTSAKLNLAQIFQQAQRNSGKLME